MKAWPPIVLLLVVACASNHTLPLEGKISTQDAVRIATKELEHRHYYLPKTYTVKLQVSSMIEEAAPETPVYELSFYAPVGHRETALYEVSVNRNSGRIEALVNMRTLVPSGKYKAQKPH
jgi:hypothetical protein